MKRDNSGLGIKQYHDDHPLSAAYQAPENDDTILTLIGLAIVGALLVGGVVFFFSVVLPVIAPLVE